MLAVNIGRRAQPISGRFSQVYAPIRFVGAFWDPKLIGPNRQQYGDIAGLNRQIPDG
jgi:hypothetical protein